MMLSSDTDNQFRRALPPEALPPTMADTVHITRAIGIPYIWIDALCIYQDSEDDFASETSKMQQIYRGATLAIYGSSADKISDPLFELRDNRHIRLPWKDGTRPSEYIYLRHESNETRSKLSSSPVHTRGWCLQEALLATRGICIGKQRMIFECTQWQLGEVDLFWTQDAQEGFRDKVMMRALGDQRHCRCKKPRLAFLKRPSCPPDNISGHHLDGTLEFMELASIIILHCLCPTPAFTSIQRF